MVIGGIENDVMIHALGGPDITIGVAGGVGDQPGGA
jgi:hypothetical protein